MGYQLLLIIAYFNAINKKTIILVIHQSFQLYIHTKL